MIAMSADRLTRSASKAAPATAVRRRLTPDAARALEKLGHAIEYLSDELMSNFGPVDGPDDRLEAIELLMSLNRQVYYEAPRVPTFRERCMALLHRAA